MRYISKYRMVDLLMCLITSIATAMVMIVIHWSLLFLMLLVFVPMLIKMWNLTDAIYKLDNEIELLEKRLKR